MWYSLHSHRLCGKIITFHSTAIYILLSKSKPKSFGRSVGTWANLWAPFLKQILCTQIKTFKLNTSLGLFILNLF